MDNFKIEYKEENVEFPLHLNSTVIREPGIYCKRRLKTETPISNINEYVSSSSILYKFDSDDFLDPYSLFFCLDVVNISPNVIQLDHSAHSLIEKIEIFRADNNERIEVIENYAVETALDFDLKLSIEDRIRRRQDEGFGDNSYGTNEVSIPPKDIDHPKSFEVINFAEMPFPNEIIPESSAQMLSQQEFPIPDYEKLTVLNDWQYVKDGKLTNYSAEEMYPHIRSFKIPLMLKTIGHGIQKDNFKYVPMRVFGPLFIKIHINKYAFFVPTKITKNDYINENFNGIESQLVPAKRDFEIRNTVIQYEIIEYSSHIKSQLMNQVANHGWITDYKGLVLSNQFYLMNYPSFDGVAGFKDKNQIRAIYITLTTDLYQKTPYARRLARHNRGFKKIEFRYRNEIVPTVIYDHNSLNTHGDKNAAYFYDQYMKSTANLNGTVVSYRNFCLNNSLSESVGLYMFSKSTNDVKNSLKELIDYTDPRSFYDYQINSKLLYAFNAGLKAYNKYKKIEEYDKFDGYIDEFACRTIYTVNFDNMPYSADAYRNGLQVQKESDSFKLSFHRVDNFLKYDPFALFGKIYTVLNVYLEFYETAVLNSQGTFSYS